VTFGITSARPLEPGPPLLIIAGAGSGKTSTLAHRVAHLIASGADPRRILLLTFTRRAAEAMIRRAERICADALRGRSGLGERLAWAGTFHAVGARLLRLQADEIGLDPAFTVLDRSDAADLLDLVRDDLGLAAKDRRFPKKATCLAIYSHAVNAQCDVASALERAFPWCADHEEDLKALFRAYVDAKQRQNLLDYDDLLLYWFHLMAEPRLARLVSERFDHVLVDEYQDTNALQAGILMNLRPSGRGLTVVGDDAQSIYGFRAASVRNILEFPERFDPPAAIVTLERNYRKMLKRLPKTHVLLISILPRQPQYEWLPAAVREANALLADIAAKRRRVTFLDISERCRSDDGSINAELYKPDLLHLSEAGYRVWADALQEPLKAVTH